MNSQRIAFLFRWLMRLRKLRRSIPWSVGLGKPIGSLVRTGVVPLPARRCRQLDIDIVRVRHARARRVTRWVVSAEWPTAMLSIVLPCNEHLDEA